MGTPIITCLPADWHPDTGVCDAPVWLTVNLNALPPLTAAEGAQIGLAIWLAWAGAWGIRVLARHLRA